MGEQSMISHKKIHCVVCPGLAKCNRYCSLRIGNNIASFINGLDCEEVQLGEVEQDFFDKKVKLVTTGYIIDGAQPTFVKKECGYRI